MLDTTLYSIGLLEKDPKGHRGGFGKAEVRANELQE